MTKHPMPSAKDGIRLRLGTRNSPLAMVQAEEVRDRLCATHHWNPDEVELVPVIASGDKVQDRPLAEIGGKALWTKELDQWLSDGRIDGAVHSAKDVETIRPAEFSFAAVLPRADRRDSLIGAPSIASLPQGAKVGTSAPRRAAQLRNLRPDCEVVTFRGNVATRLAKLEAGEADATFLAAAGLSRLGMSEVGNPLPKAQWIAAAGQGAIVIEALSARAEAFAALSALDDEKTRGELKVERSLLAELGGTCHSPVAAECHWGDDQVSLRAALFSADGSERVEAKLDFEKSDHAAPKRVARDLMDRASAAILRNFNAPS
ncbi:MAG: hydroxymethylbilane synthase [Erythrobacter sp.]